jgi:hypothetical protein
MTKIARLVEDGIRRHGRFEATPVANPLDEFAGARRAWEGFRLKEWAGFTLTHPDLYSSMILQDAKYLANSEIYVYDRATGDLVERSAAAPGGSLGLPTELAKGRVALKARGYKIAYNFEPTRVRIMVRVEPREGMGRIEANLTLDPTKASPPLVVSSPLPGERGAALYTNKLIYPASGVLKVDGRVYKFDPARDFATLDEHKSHLPYRTDWTWGTFAMVADGGYMGSNFVTRPQYDDREEESCIWTPTAAEPLRDVAFEPLGGGDLDPWSVSSADGRLEVVFTPEGAKGVSKQFGAAAISYWQKFGTYAGRLQGESRSVEFADVHGVLEGMHARL